MIKYARKGLFLLSLFGLFPASLNAGAVIKIFRLDFPHKKVILLAEHHKGPRVEEIARNQYFPFARIFKDLEQVYGKAVLYLEAHDDYCKQLKEYQESNFSSNLFGDPISLFDDYISLYAHGVTLSPQFNCIKNFDDRSELDKTFSFLAICFDEFLEEYKDSGFDPDIFSRAKKEFFESEEYGIFAERFDEWMQVFPMRLEQKINLVKNLLPDSDKHKIDMLVNSYKPNWQILQKIEVGAAHTKRTLFELLFDLEGASPGNLFKALQRIFHAYDYLDSVFEIFDCSNLIADLDLVHIILTDNSPIQFVHGGKIHMKAAYNILAASRLVQFHNELDMLDDPMLNDQEYCYSQMRDFLS